MAGTLSKPLCEKIILNDDSSWRYWLYEVNSLDFHWHYHPEYEICLTLNSRGQRYIGDHMQAYGDLDLVLIGPNLPHAWRSEDSIRGQEQQVYVAQLPTVWLDTLTKNIPEMQPIKDILQTSLRGILFSAETAKEAKKLFLKMQKANPLSRLILLFDLLHLMQSDQQSSVLSSESYAIVAKSNSSTDKIDKVIQYIKQNYTEDLHAEDMAALAHMSTNHFHRFFKKRTEQTFKELVSQLRIGQACSLLINSHLPISNISDTCGFNNISNFNRRFLQHKDCTPTQFRNAYINNEA